MFSPAVLTDRLPSYLRWMPHSGDPSADDGHSDFVDTVLITGNNP